MAGFGGLLMLTALAGADGLRALEQIENSNDRIREEFLLRTRVLERIRTDLYRSGTDVRDYLLEPQRAKRKGIATRCSKPGETWMRPWSSMFIY